MKWAAVAIAALCALAATQTCVVEALNVAGNTVLEEGDVNWVFVTSFCFDTAGLGVLNWSVTPELMSHSGTTYELVIYDDEPSSFQDVWKHRPGESDAFSCSQLVEHRKNKDRLWATKGMHTEQFKDTNSGHQWFIAVAACNLSAGVPMSFAWNFTFANTDTPESAELGGIVAPTVFYAVFMALAVASFVIVTLRTSRLGMGALSPLVHREALAALCFVVLANICAWAWAADHERASLSAMMFFQGLSQWFLTWCTGFLAVANKTLEPLGKYMSWIYFGLAPVYFLCYFIAGTQGEPFPGVVGSAVFSNGWAITASIFRFMLALLWLGVMFFSWRANRHQGGSDHMHVLQWFVFGFAVFLWLFVMPVAVWANAGQIYSCSPASLVAGYAVAAIFDGCILVLLLVALDPVISQGIFGDILGEASILTLFMPFKWNSIDWSTSAPGSSFQSSGYSTLAEGGIGSDDFGDSASHQKTKAAGGASDYQTL